MTGLDQLQGTFPSGQVTLNGNAFACNMADNPPAGPGWTLGRKSIMPVTAQATLIRPWTIYGFAVHGQGVLSPKAGVPPSGVPGKLMASVYTTTAPGTQGPVAFEPPTHDAIQNLVTLWDGASEPPFPMLPASGLPAGGTFNGSLQLPQPVPLVAGSQVAIGIWLTPALMNQVTTAIYNVIWTILYSRSR